MCLNYLVLNRMKHKPKKNLGQNFLINSNVAKKIIQYADLHADDWVIEIGPGTGVLTTLITNVTHNLIAYELDNELYLKLLNEFLGKAKIINADFLKIPNLASPQKQKIIANIPYYITSPILFKLFENNKYIDFAILMVQNEIADRLIAKPKTSAYGKLTVTTNYYANVEKLFIVPRNNFFPSPNVDSAVIKLTFKPLVFQQSDKFISFIKSAFAMQRKTLANNLKNINIVFDDKLQKETNLKKMVRPQELTLDEFITLFNVLNKNQLL